jgi:hypothetical protein
MSSQFAIQLRRLGVVAAPPAPENPTAVERMACRLRTPQGKRLYGLRKQTSQPDRALLSGRVGINEQIYQSPRIDPLYPVDSTFKFKGEVSWGTGVGSQRHVSALTFRLIALPPRI